MLTCLDFSPSGPRQQFTSLPFILRETSELLWNLRNEGWLHLVQKRTSDLGDMLPITWGETVIEALCTRPQWAPEDAYLLCVSLHIEGTTFDIWPLFFLRLAFT